MYPEKIYFSLVNYHNILSSLWFVILCDCIHWYPCVFLNELLSEYFSLFDLKVCCNLCVVSLTQNISQTSRHNTSDLNMTVKYCVLARCKLNKAFRSKLWIHFNLFGKKVNVYRWDSTTVIAQQRKLSATSYVERQVILWVVLSGNVTFSSSCNHAKKSDWRDWRECRRHERVMLSGLLDWSL